ncbi:hypothetical protein BX666DRAFT_2121756 [Dichotomocladium elegans]|nr:hypothetical protein BX666DRAFT_2121756 [Dichotomocladium elegans]
MISTGTIFALGAAGMAGAAYASSRSRRRSVDQQSNTSTTESMTPFSMGRRPSGGMQNDGYAAHNQADLFWRRDYGANFSHNSSRKFPRDLHQTSL